MDRFEEMRVFAAVAQLESFADAARQLALSPPRVTRAVAALEARLGVALLQRTTRQVRVTEAGRRYLEDAQQVLAQLAEAEAAATGSYLTPRGLLHMTAPVLFGEYFVTPQVVDYLEQYPDVQVRAELIDRPVNLQEEGIDVAVRIGHVPQDCQHLTVPVGEVRQVVCASPAWLAEHGEPAHPQELEALPTVVAEGGNLSGHWWFEEEGKRIEVTPSPRLRITAIHAALTAVEAGAGLTRLLSYQVAASEAEGRVRRVLTRFEPVAIPINIWVTAGRGRAASVRTFVDFLAERLRADPALAYRS
ncbi:MULTISPECIES: LysR family transcriptional regulator [Halomonadaceae]|uniref:LysR family transcriptional regulator n=1 Tax=Halomonadaceae TaxID=28256 RepID=UPI0012F01AA5|nr:MULTISPECIES: LysR family transcriptional regulator [Halomonas]CAD5261643.1 Transcriptional regulator, LysR family [Halomonas sp. 59]CAD5261926.1 Transcriptional regulator, LysR family [Halomonas sp. 113]CAD5275926.1 Transcriptional regulator, LysR family [Halomonas sp. I3]CAD5286739.1 Transcriptional regulator, LysR family [Halomonas sp. 156]VXB46498.1 Transcriptional regulator, LysR family [Halomonas titanicae]